MASSVTTRAENLPAIANLEELSKTHTGLEGASAKDIAIPFLLLMQSMSPAVKKGPDQIKGAEEGDFMHSVSKAIFKGDVGVNFILCSFRKQWLEWKPRGAGSGLADIHDTDALVDQCKRVDKVGMVLPNGNTLVETAQHYGLIVGEDGSLSRIVLSMSKTQLKKSRQWLSLITNVQVQGSKGMFNPPAYTYMYRLKSVQETGTEGAYANWLIGESTPCNNEQFQAALVFSQAVNSGAVKALSPAPEESEHNDKNVI